MTVTLVTGANSGIGRAAALHLAGLGHTVYGAMRDLSRGDKLASMAEGAGVVVHPIQLDVTDDVSVRTAVASVVATEGRLDVLVNNAGLGHNGVTEDLDIDEGKAIFDVNYWGVIRCVQAALPAMRDQGSGVILNVSSVTGRIAALANTAYASSKWAVECLSDALAQETAPFGIRIKIVEPGVTRTAILPKNSGYPDNPVYEPAYRRMEMFYRAGALADVRPEVVAETIAEAIADESAQLRYVCAYGGQELVDGLADLSDADWIAMGAAATDEEYCKRFEAAFGLDIRTEL
jgi:NAD(P)-dependent dehydrogenase (short-subunit alcohol dehydrogenase family)